jgi:hypothetical protein
MPSTDLVETATSPTPPRSVSVRIDADTRAKLAELQKRLLDQSSRGPDIEVRRAGIPLGAVVEKALRALEKELNAPTARDNATEEAISRVADG